MLTTSSPYKPSSFVVGQTGSISVKRWLVYKNYVALDTDLMQKKIWNRRTKKCQPSRKLLKSIE